MITFVLGPVKEPPATKFLFTPDARQQAIVDGRQVLERSNCGGCHTLKMEQWLFGYEGDSRLKMRRSGRLPLPRSGLYGAQQIAASLAHDRAE